MPFWKKKPNEAQGTALERTIRDVMRDADAEAVTLVAAVAGLLLQVAYEDRPYLHLRRHAPTRGYHRDHRGA